MKLARDLQQLVDQADRQARPKAVRSSKKKAKKKERARAAVVVLSERAKNRKALHDDRAAAKGRIEKLRYQLRKAREQSAKLQKQIRSKRDATSPRLREQIKRFRAKWRAWVNARVAEMRQKHRQVWNKRLDSARAAVLRAQFELDAERGVQSDLRKFRGSQRRAKRSLPKTGKRRASVTRIRRDESDDQVEGNIDPALVPVWREVKDQIRTDFANKSRTEAFLEWVDENPQDVATLTADLAYDSGDLEAELAEQEARAYADADAYDVPF
ncbi:MAG TPA: hypothetical protein VMY40_15060 [Anaerolineae bacterium]|nr:hypothetical protein [Anaerolineae bacterium]